jgi:Histidine kinase-, DNA gyrase B-, and HSP90-like ATPase
VADLRFKAPKAVGTKRPRRSERGPIDEERPVSQDGKPAGAPRPIGIQSALAAQREYAERAGRRSRFGLMVPEAFVRGIRDIGYRSNGDALAELIDNALQAFATRVDVAFGYGGTKSLKKPSQLAIIDNGHGLEPAMMRMAVMWGGTHREDDRSGLGRYGYGLPCASVSLGRRFTIYSAITEGALHSVTLDLDALAAGEYSDVRGEINVPSPERAVLPQFVADHIDRAFPDGWASGTVILLEKLDRLEWYTAQALRENLSRQFGVTYHKLRGEAALFVDHFFVEPIDPLFLTVGFHLHALDADRANPLDPIEIEVRDPESGEIQGWLSLRYAWLPPSFGSIDKSRDAVGLNANPRFAILKDYHGIIFSRNGRLIDVQTRAPWTTFINNDRYIKVEVEFSATLDEAFGVTTSKQQVTIKPYIWDLLREAGVPKAIEQLRAKVKEAKLDRRIAALSPQPGERVLSERAMDIVATQSGSEHQFNFDLPLAHYRLQFEALPGSPFFRVAREAGARTLHINTAHRFYDTLYDTPCATQEFKSTLEILLFCFGDVVLEAADPAQAGFHRQIHSWSRRLDQALATMVSHLTRGEDMSAEPQPAGH